MDPQPMPQRVAMKLLGAWMFVGVPLAYGVYQTVCKAIDLFR